MHFATTQFGVRKCLNARKRKGMRTMHLCVRVVYIYANLKCNLNNPQTMESADEQSKCNSLTLLSVTFNQLHSSSFSLVFSRFFRFFKQSVAFERKITNRQMDNMHLVTKTLWKNQQMDHSQMCSTFRSDFVLIRFSVVRMFLKSFRY